MLRLPTRLAAVILSFAPLFFQRSWRHAEVLLIGAILAPGKRTVKSLLRVTGLAREQRFVNYHRVLSRAAWSSRAASRLLLGSGPIKRLHGWKWDCFTLAEEQGQYGQSLLADGRTGGPHGAVLPEVVRPPPGR